MPTLTRLRFDRHSDDSIAISLYYLRGKIIREGGDGLDYVEALLRLLGREPDAMPVPVKTPRRFRNGQLRRTIMTMLRDAPMTSSQIADAIHPLTPWRTRKQVIDTVRHTLNSMRATGFVRREGRMWITHIPSAPG
jgi:hypothetical protein